MQTTVPTTVIEPPKSLPIIPTVPPINNQSPSQIKETTKQKINEN